MGSQGLAQTVLRFQSMNELVDHFRALGASEEALQAAQSTFETTGMAGLTFSEKAH